MKLTLALLLAGIPAASAFSAPRAFGVAQRTGSVSLDGSKSTEKGKKRTKWAEGRGFGAGAAVAAPAPAAAGTTKNEAGLDLIRLVHPSGATSEVYPFGGVVTSYVVDGTEFIAVRPDAKTDGSKPISGGLSHCWPQFGPGAIQQHGFARNVVWDVKEVTDTSVELEMAPSDYTKEIWDKPFRCTFTVSLGEDSLSTKMLVKNEGEEAFDFQAALHSYFTVSSLDKLEIAGSFEGKEFLNKLAGDGGEMQTETRSALVIDQEYDRVYSGINDPVLKDSGTGKSLAVLNTAGYEDTVIWNPYGDEGMGYNNFVCAESVKFDPVTLAGGESWNGDMSLKPSAL